MPAAAATELEDVPGAAAATEMEDALGAAAAFEFEDSLGDTVANEATECAADPWANYVPNAWEAEWETVQAEEYKFDIAKEALARGLNESELFGRPRSTQRASILALILRRKRVSFS